MTTTASATNIEKEGNQSSLQRAQQPIQRSIVRKIEKNNVSMEGTDIRMQTKSSLLDHDATGVAFHHGQVCWKSFMRKLLPCSRWRHDKQSRLLEIRQRLLLQNEHVHHMISTTIQNFCLTNSYVSFHIADMIVPCSRYNYKYEPLSIYLHVLDIVTGHTIHPSERVLSSPSAHANTYLEKAAFVWNVRIDTSIPFEKFLSPQTLVLMEVIHEKHTKNHGNSKPGNPDMMTCRPSDEKQHIAWAFYRVISENGKLKLDTFRDDVFESTNKQPICCQLFHYQQLSQDDLRGYQSQMIASTNNATIPRVYFQFLNQKRTLFPSDLCIFINATDESNLLETQTKNSESVLSNSGQTEAASSNSSDNEASPTIVNLMANCMRGPLKPCLIPHRVLCKLPTGTLSPSCIAFCKNGTYLAAGVYCEQECLLYIYRVSTGQLCSVGHGHQRVIQTIEWNHQSSSMLLTASSDGTARVWSIVCHNSKDRIVHLQSIFQHFPVSCIVFCAIFGEYNDQNFCYTGASDGNIRIWNLQSQQFVGYLSPTKSNDHENEGGCIPAHENAAVHCLRVNEERTQLYSGDSLGRVFVWTNESSSSTSQYFCFNVTKIIDCRLLGGFSIISINLHPRKQNLLLQAHPNVVLELDLRSYLLLNTRYERINCKQFMHQTVFSPDGRYVLIGSDSGSPCLFTTSYQQNIRYSTWKAPLMLFDAMCTVSWHPSAHIVAVGSCGQYAISFLLLVSS